MNDRSDEHRRSPIPAEEQEFPEPERMITPEEEAGMSIEDLDDPPQAEGKREPDEDFEPQPAD